ncbi:Fungalysin metallopeptidase-domain-containing protein, partial [Syncephalis pseudoplumigaleata]
THVYLRQMVHGSRVEAATMNIHVDANRQIIAYSSSFHTGPKPAKPPAWSPDDPAMQRSMLDALRLLAVHIGRRISKHAAIEVVPQRGQSENDVKYRVAKVPFATEPIAVRRMFIHTKGSRLDLAWEFTVKLAVDHICAHVSVDRPRVLALFNWADRYTYKAIPVTDRNILTSRVRLIKDPEKAFAPDYDWHTVEGVRYSTLSGNNAFIADWRGHTAIEGSNGQFIFPFNSPDNYAKGAAVNAFYVVNAMHDLFSKYGFTEPKGNFQQYNFKRGGIEKDPVEIYVQDPGVPNNAVFTTPPDGQSGVLRLGIVSIGYPPLDIAWCNELIVHEVTHGLVRRSIGSTRNSNVLGTTEARGLSEGWCDFVSVWVRLDERTDPMAAIPFTTFLPFTTRHYPLSLDRHTNPLTYRHLQLLALYNKKHTIGTIWCTMLYEVYWALVRRLGFTREKNEPSLEYGNTLTLKLMIYALAVTDEHPTFINARDMILLSERVLTRKAYHCDIWRAFASRGLGFSAK